MIKMNPNKIVLIFIVLSLAMNNVSAIGLAVAPSTIEINNGLKGTEYIKSLVIVNSDDKPTNYSLRSSGDMSDWITYYEMNNLDNPISSVSINGKDKKQVIIKVKIPDTAANGNYTSELIVESAPDPGISGQSVALKMSSLLKVGVTGDQTLSGIIKSLLISDTEENIPLIINMEFENTGNVIANPIVELKIFNKNDPEKVIDTVLFEEGKIGINKKEIIQIPWDTRGKSLGDYHVNVSISLGGNVLQSKDMDFKILPIGTITRTGKLDKIYIDGEVAVDSPVKINADFINTGRINTIAKFTGEIYKEGSLIDTIKSEEIMVLIGEPKKLTAYATFKSDGIYLIKGKVTFGGKETDIVEYSFDVGGKKKKSTPGFEAIFAALMVIALMLLNRKKENHK